MDRSGSGLTLVRWNVRCDVFASMLFLTDNSDGSSGDLAAAWSGDVARLLLAYSRRKVSWCWISVGCGRPARVWC
jgi:hypothetical protein